SRAYWATALRMASAREMFSRRQTSAKARSCASGISTIVRMVPSSYDGIRAKSSAERHATDSGNAPEDASERVGQTCVRRRAHSVGGAECDVPVRADQHGPVVAETVAPRENAVGIRPLAWRADRVRSDRYVESPRRLSCGVDP